MLGKPVGILRKELNPVLALGKIPFPSFSVVVRLSFLESSEQFLKIKELTLF